jgi:outer membrane protein OmpU
MKKILLSAVATLCLSGIAYAEKTPVDRKVPAVKIFGFSEAQYAIVDQDNKTNYATGGTLARHGLSIKNRIKFAFDDETTGGLKYGSYVSLRGDADAEKMAVQAYVYAENCYGKALLGAHESASEAMQVTAANIDLALGGIDSSFSKYLNQKVLSGATEYEMSDIFILSPYFPVNLDNEGDANKITYYTPMFSGLQFGVSFTPDAEMIGTASAFRGLDKTKANAGELGYRDVFDVGLSYEGKVMDFEYKLATTGQFGKAKLTPAGKLRDDLRAWDVGAKLKFKESTLILSYADLGKSGTIRERLADHKYGSKYWTAGLRYDVSEEFAVGLTHMKSQKAGNLVNVHETDYNKFQSQALSADYKIAKGLKLYSEIVRFKTKTVDPNITDNKGTIFILGTKINY